MYFHSSNFYCSELCKRISKVVFESYLQAPSSTTGQNVVSPLSSAPIRSNFAKSIIPPSLLVSEPRNLLPSSAPRLTSYVEPPRFYRTPEDDKIKSNTKQEKDDVPQKVKFFLIT